MSNGDIEASSLRDFNELQGRHSGGLSETLEKTLWFTVVYAVLITILVATLKIKKDDK